MRFAILLCAVSVTLAFSGTLQWPTGPAGTRNDTRTLLNTYGSPNKAWADVYNHYYYSVPPTNITNFHAGVDVKWFSSDPLIEDDEVYPIESGYFIDIPFDILVEYSDGSRATGVHYTIGASQLSDFGWCYQHLLWSTDPLWGKFEEISTFDLISKMDPVLQTDHTHLMWADANYTSLACGFDPLNELRFEPHTGYPSAMLWNWRQDRYAIYIIPQYEDGIASWRDVENFSEIEVNKESVSGAVDILLEYYLEALGQYPDPTFSTPSDDHSVTPQKMEWFVSRETIAGPVEIFSRKVMNFDIEDLGGETYLLEYLLHYFKITEPESPFPDQDDQEGVCCCLSNCGDEQSFTNMGLTNIEENCWQTDGLVGSDGFAGEGTINPILQETPDGEYSVSVISYAYNDMDSDTYVEDGIILRNSSPALSEVLITNAATAQEYYHAIWQRSSSSAVLYIPDDENVPTNTNLDVVLTFTEEMDPNSIYTFLGPYTVTNGSWSSVVVPNDTWSGEVSFSSDGIDGFYTLSVSATDTDNNSLMDPEGVGEIPITPEPDTHHAVSLSYGVDLAWSVTLPEPIRGSVALDDIDGDGFMELAVQTEEGTVHIYNHDGTVLSGWPRSDTGYYPAYHEAQITPASVI